MDDNQCRVCLGGTEDSRYSVFKKVNGVAIEEKLRFVCNLKITEDDGFSKTICKKCFNDTCISYALKTKCLDTDRTLKILEKKLNEKLSKLSQTMQMKTVVKVEEHLEPLQSFDEQYEVVEMDPNQATFKEEQIVFEDEAEVFQAAYETETTETFDMPNEIYEEIEYLEPEILIEREIEAMKSVPSSKISVNKKDRRKNVKSFDNFRMRQSSTTAQNRCRGCQLDFETIEDLRTHLRVSGCKEIHEKPFKCYICEESFTMGITKKKHIQTKHQDKAGADCPLCLRCRIPSAVAFENHYKTHFAEPRFCCNYCARPFYESDRLQLHIRRSHETTKFECNWCGKTFRDKSGITRHILGVHFNQRNHRCHFCLKAFTENYNLKEHLFSVHKLATNCYNCDLCNTNFLYRKQFDRHRKECNGIPEKRKR